MNYTYTLPSETGYNLTKGLDQYFTWIIYEQPAFIGYFLLMIWAVIFMGGTFTEKRITSKENYIKWGFLASFVTFGISIILTFVAEFNVTTEIIISGVAVVVFALVWFAADKVIGD